MKKIITIVLTVFFCTIPQVQAFKIIQIKEDDSYLAGKNVADDKAYLNDIVMRYSDRYVVEETAYADISDIDRIYTNLSGASDFQSFQQIDLEYIQDEYYKKKMHDFNLLAGFCGYAAQFEPVAYFNIYRDLTLVGGYVQYTKQYENPDEAYWQYVCTFEQQTKEIIPYETRLKLLDKVRELAAFMEQDTGFKVFILKDGKVDSMFERV